MMRTFILLLALLLPVRAEAIMLVGFGGGSCATQTQDVSVSAGESYVLWVDDAIGQSITPTASGVLYSVELGIAAADGDETITIRGGTSADLTSSYDFEVSANPTSGTWYDLAFVIPSGSRPTLTASTPYYIVAHVSGGNVTLVYDSTGAYAGGIGYTDASGTNTWAPTTAADKDFAVTTNMCD